MRAFYSHPSAIIESQAIGNGTKIWQFAHVREQAVIGSNCNLGKGVYIDTGVEIGRNVKIQNFTSVYQGVKIEDDVFIGPSVTFTNDLYPRAFIWDGGRVGRTVVKKGASIGANATIVCGVTIGEYAMVGAGSVVTKDIPPFSLYYGNPAKPAGHVCYCGQKLERVIKEDKGEIQYECRCGKKVSIKGEWLE